MRAVIQRVKESEVVIDGKSKAKIGQGLLILLGIEAADGMEDIEWLSRKIVHMRIFNDSDGIMNLSVKEIQGEIIAVSQFTLHANTKKGNRPSYIRAANPDFAQNLYEEFKKRLSIEFEKDIQSGEFGADMKVSLINDGPVTILIDSKNKEL